MFCLSPNFADKNDTTMTTTNTLTSLLLAIFADPSTDDETKVLKLTQAQKKALSTLMMSDAVDKTLWEKTTAKAILERDPTLQTLAEVACCVALNQHSEVSRTFLQRCAELVSMISSLNPLGNHNIFETYSNQLSDENTPKLQFIANKLQTHYDTRYKSIEEAEKREEAGDGTRKSTMTRKTLRQQEASVLALACLWCSRFEKASHEDLFATLKMHYKADQSRSDERAPHIDVFVARQLKKTDGRDFIDIIEHFASREAQQNKEILQRKAEILDLKQKQRAAETAQIELQSALYEANQRAKLLELEIETLKQQLSSHQLDQRAERVHLRDDTDKMRSKALNLLEDDLNPMLITSLKALKHTPPLLDHGVNYIERAQLQIEGAIAWFKK